ncbi:MAG TPA: hypothetical protein VH858_15635 [Hyphomicrobiales bacterium]|jgi:hypothetical protein
MPTLRHLTVALFAVIGASVPAGAYIGYFAPACAWSTVWTWSGAHYQYVCF